MYKYLYSSVHLNYLVIQPHLVPDVGEKQKLFPISTVSEATGVPTVTLRAWERRYDFLEPERTEKGHRLYSVDHIDLIRRVTALIDSGVPVGRVSTLLKSEAKASEPFTAGELWRDAENEVFETICAFDEARLDHLFDELLARFSIASITEKLIVPLLKRLGLSWQQRVTGVAEEHFFSLYIRNKLGAWWQQGARSIAGRRLVAACMPGEQHEYGLLLFALAARARGMDLILLGANMPLDELPRVVEKTRAAGVVLSSIYPPDAKLISEKLAALVVSLDKPLFVGGSGVAMLQDEMQSAGVVCVGDEFVTAVEGIHKYLAAKPKGVNAGE